MSHPEEALELVVLVGGRLATYRLPPAGAVAIGRSEKSAVRIDDPSVSRQHALLHVGRELRIEDAGSANGTRLRRQVQDARAATSGVQETLGTSGGAERGGKVEPGAPVKFEIGDILSVGSALLVVRRLEVAARPVESVEGSGRPVIREPSMRKLCSLAERVAQGPISVLLLGETGVGKEVFAEVIHRASPRSKKPFLGLNCAALSETLLESELFGHERGAFTGAVSSKPGLLESAEGGTVFLDEVGEMPLSIQVKLLRVLEERKVTRVGGLSPRSIDVRFVAATNRDLEAAVKAGTFRQDLLFRLNGISLTIPPLRERPAEVEPLARLFAARAAASMGQPAPHLSADAVVALQQYAWPGNVRELRNVIERAVVLCAHGPSALDAASTAVSGPRAGDVITVEHLMLPPDPPETTSLRTHDERATAQIPAHVKAELARRVEMVARASEAATASGGSLRSELDALERRRILDALDACGGNQTRAAAMLGVPRRTLVARLDQYGIARPRKKQ